MHSVSSTQKYSADFNEDWPLSDISDMKNNKLLEDCINIRKPSDTSLDVITENSDKFQIKFPIQTIKCANLTTDRNLLTSHINSTYPLLHESVLILIEKFLKYKSEYGSSIEKSLYKDMRLVHFVQRLLDKRAVTFVGPHDRFVLLNNETGAGGWEQIGTDSETSPLLLKDYLSYDELKISALLSVTSFTEFINNGSRNNCGKPTKDKSEIQNNGVIIGLIGPRLKRVLAMDYQDMVITAKQNIGENGYGNSGQNLSKQHYRELWSNFFNEPNFTYENAMELYKNEVSNKVSRYTIVKKELFDNICYKKRLSISFDTLIIEANSRAKAAGTTAFVHVVGIGLGVWKCSEHQEQVFLDTFAQRLRYLLPQLNNVSDVVFAYFNSKICGDVNNGEKFEYDGHPSGGIKIQFSTRDPHDRLTGPNADKLLVVSYAWDSNALPGNEFWCGKLSSSGDPAAACSTQIAELHNPHINRAKVNGQNLHVASVKYGVLHVADYARLVFG